MYIHEYHISKLYLYINFYFSFTSAASNYLLSTFLPLKLYDSFNYIIFLFSTILTSNNSSIPVLLSLCNDVSNIDIRRCQNHNIGSATSMGNGFFLNPDLVLFFVYFRSLTKLGASHCFHP